MEKLLTILLGLMISLSTFGQLSHSFSIEATPLISYRQIKSENNGNIKNKYLYFDATQLKNTCDTTEYPSFGYALNLYYNLEMKKFTFSTGIGYCNIGETYKRIFSKGHKEINNGGYAWVYDGREEFKFNYSYNYIGIPLKVSYKLFDKSWDLSVFVEGNINYLTSYTIHKPTNMDELMFPPTFKTDFAVINKFVVGTDGGLTLTNQLNEKLSLLIQPYFFLQMTPSLTIENELRQYNYNGGITFGLTRKI